MEWWSLLACLAYVFPVDHPKDVFGATLVHTFYRDLEWKSLIFNNNPFNNYGGSTLSGSSNIHRSQGPCWTLKAPIHLPAYLQVNGNWEDGHEIPSGANYKLDIKA